MKITLGMLSWGQHKTLLNTLESYKKYGLLDIVDEKILFFQEISNEDVAIAEKYNFSLLGAPKNVGIAEGYKELINSADNDLFLFLENDWELLRDPKGQIYDARDMLDLELIDVARFRDRHNPGHPLWTRQFEGNEMSRPEHLLDCIHWTDPEKFEDIAKWGSWYIVKAKFANWTNNPTMYRTEWLKEVILPRMSGDVERNIQDWWQHQDYVVAQSEGLFTHNRIG